ncbi:MAG: GDSL-type esterase/lipase family protein [Gammaproteobacteria bacterium]|nr:GDSL-type esterase/lipase family protein [Gammaproteobacteria bacterium]
MKCRQLIHILIALCLSISLASCADKAPLLTPLGDEAVILSFGDSLTYGSGVNSTTQSYPAVLSQLTNLKVINKGIPGEVSEEGIERLVDVLQETQPNLVILCHGGNDIIRKLGKEQLKNNLSNMIELIQSSGADVVLVGVPNFNLMLNVPEFYSELAAQYNIPIELTILPKIERNPQMKSDQIHPNVKGYRLMAESINNLLHESGAF